MSWDSAGPKAETCHSSSAGLHPETRQQLESSWRGNVSQTQLEAEDAQLERVVIDNSRKQPLRAPGQGSMLGCQLGCWLPVRLRYQRLQTLPCLVGGREARPTYPRLCAAFDPPTQSPPSKWSGLACLEQERHQRQGSQGQAEWRRPDQDIEDNTLQVPEVLVPLRKQLEAQESHPRLCEEMAEYWRTRWHQVAVALKFKEEELQRLQMQSGTWPPQGRPQQRPQASLQILQREGAVGPRSAKELESAVWTPPEANGEWDLL
ncbi:uncharacterized protein LOC111529699 isoform X2 [Piliocolobus tephrosceles]|uniref:uncharacterized protein LOC111529699 isoform X2 n=1 Tax=Piliocolobus tephrosceles TaxID=591936 RepID=UPI000C29F4F2|nr:uncharacterized protein LOC111529699 isoform X2 [Piliocolobus tephrosceles]